MDALIGFISGVGVSLTGALVANLLTRIREHHKFIEDKQFKIYMMLMELYGSYFGFTTAEFHHETVSIDIRNRCRSLAWQIADILREAAEVEFLDEILDVLFGPSFTTATERYTAMGQILDKIGLCVNPRYSHKIQEISKRNLKALTSGSKSNAPGNTWP
jgi:hypothetical protein